MKSLTDEEQITLAAYNKLAAKWSARHAVENYWFEEMKELKYLLPGGRVLEVGAGGGRDAQELIKFGYDYTGIDISGSLLKEARRINPNADFRVISLYDLDFSEKFDGFWCAAVLLHIPRTRIHEALIAIHKNIKKSGVGFIAVKLGHGEEMKQGSHDKGDKRYFIYWQPEAFHCELVGAGFKVISQNLRQVDEDTTWINFTVRIV